MQRGAIGAVRDSSNARRLGMRPRCLRRSRHNAADRYQHEYRGEDNRKRDVGESHDVPPVVSLDDLIRKREQRKWNAILRFLFLRVAFRYAAASPF
jgi:hypothetical protein